MLRLLYKVWSGLTKYLRSQLAQQRVVEVKLLGKFAPSQESSNPLQHYIYSPSTALLAKFTPRSQPDLPDSKEVKLSITSLAIACNSSRASIKEALHLIETSFVDLTRTGSTIRLDLRVGYFVLGGPKQEVVFENYSLAAAKPPPREELLSDISALTPATRADTVTSENSKYYRKGANVYKRLDDSKQEVKRFNEGDIEVRLPAERKDFLIKHGGDSKREELLQNMRQTLVQKRVKAEERLRSLPRKSKRSKGSLSIHSPRPKSYYKDNRQDLSKTLSVSLSGAGSVSSNGRMSTSYMSSYPVFLRKSQYYPVRRLEEDALKDVRDLALRRHEASMMSIQKEQEKNERQAAELLLKDLMLARQKEKSRLLTMGAYKSDIQSQMQSDRDRKQQQIDRERQLCKTHFGPEQTPDRAQAFIDKEKRNRDTVRTWLDVQIQQKNQSDRIQREQEKLQANQGKSGVTQAIRNEFSVIDEERREEDKKAQNVYKVCHDYWQTQTRLSSNKRKVVHSLL